MCSLAIGQMAGPADMREVARLEREVAEVCGVAKAANARLVSLLAGAGDTGAWEGYGIRSVEHWVTGKCGLSAGRARSLVMTARPMAELPEVAAAFGAGALSADQVAVLARRAPAHVDADMATSAQAATVEQLSRTLARYRFARPLESEADKPDDKDRSVVGQFDSRRL